MVSLRFNLTPSTCLFAWDASEEPTAAFYVMYAGEASGDYTVSKNMGNALSGTFKVPNTGTWYFAITAEDGQGLSSGFSNELTSLVGHL